MRWTGYDPDTDIPGDIDPVDEEEWYEYHPEREIEAHVQDHEDGYHDEQDHPGCPVCAGIIDREG